MKIELEEKPIVIAKKLFLDKVKFLCSKIPDLEWSGVLFYKVIGTIRNITSLKLELKDILLMDIGTAGHTEYEFSEDVVSYQMDNEESEDWQIGLIHSHNRMTTFFSGEDWDELNINCQNHNYYLSVIVNNALDIKAKIAYTAEGNDIYKSLDEKGKIYPVRLAEKAAPLMLVNDCEIQDGSKPIIVSEDFTKRYNKIVVDYNSRANQKPKGYAPGYTNGHSYNRHDNVKQIAEKSSFPDYNGSKSYNKSYTPRDWEENIATITEEDMFIAALLRGGSELENDTYQEAIEDIEASNLPSSAIAYIVTDVFSDVYKSIYKEAPKVGTRKHYEEKLEMVIKTLKEEVLEHEFLKSVIEKLTDLAIDSMADLAIEGNDNTNKQKQDELTTTQ